MDKVRLDAKELAEYFKGEENWEVECVLLRRCLRYSSAPGKFLAECLLTLLMMLKVKTLEQPSRA